MSYKSLERHSFFSHTGKAGGLLNYTVMYPRQSRGITQGIYKLRWMIETFFGWWKRHLKVYHLKARSPYGLLMQILSGLITYLLLAMYCHEKHGERVSIQQVREFRNTIRNKVAAAAANAGLASLDVIDLDLSAYAIS